MMTMSERRRQSGGEVETSAASSAEEVLGSPSSLQTVVVLCDLTYEVSATERLTIRAQEQLLLLEQTNEDWWMVARVASSPSSPEVNHHHRHSSPFFVPTSYIKLLSPTEVACDSLHPPPPPPPPAASTSAEDCDDLRCELRGCKNSFVY